MELCLGGAIKVLISCQINKSKSLELIIQDDSDWKLETNNRGDIGQAEISPEIRPTYSSRLPSLQIQESRRSLEWLRS